MKKNAMLKIAAILMVAVLLTTCAMSSTFAKYVTKGNDQSDDARVAKWGVAINTTFDGLFVETYNNADSVETVASAVEVVAPGASTSTTIETDITGTPEVDFAITVSKCDLTLTGWKLANDVEYCPLVFTVRTMQYAIGTPADSTTTITYVEDMADLELAVEEAIEAACIGNFQANTEYKATAVDNPSTTDVNEAVAADISVVVGWSWAYETAGNDANDTYLGDQAALGNASTVKLEITQTATQID